MPIQPSMAQLSRPYQIGLVAIALLAAVWLLLFQGHHSSTSEPSASAPPAATRTVKAPTAAPKAPSHATAGQATGSGSASSLGAYGHAIEKARGAVATSQKNASELASKSAQASSASTPSSNAGGTATADAPAKTTAPSATVTKSTTVVTKGATVTRSATVTTHAKAKSAPAGSAAPTRQRMVEAQLNSGRIAVIFFWNARGSDDRAVHRALASLPHNLRFTVNEASSGEVATFGSITRGVQVYGTPTLLVVNSKGEVTTLTGLQDSFTIAQAIREARQS
jgi:hypothetical protein